MLRVFIATLRSWIGFTLIPIGNRRTKAKDAIGGNTVPKTVTYSDRRVLCANMTDRRMGRTLVSKLTLMG